MRIIFADKDNLDELSPLLQSWAKEMKYDVSNESIKNDLTRFVDDGIIIVVKDDDESVIGIMVGIVCFHFWINEHIAHEHWFFVRSDKRQNGLGNLMLEVFTTWAKSKKCKSVIISPNSFGSNNPKTIANALIKKGYHTHGYEMKREI